MNNRLAQQLALLPDYLSQHLLLSITALAIGISISLPLAIVAFRVRGLRTFILSIANIIQTIPSLALLALMVPLLREIGFLPAVIALILYSMLPVIRNTVTGLQEVDANLVEAGRGLGMTENQLLAKVQLPQAMPMIIAGIRTATVWVVGIATLSTPVGAVSLGNYIFAGLQTQNHTAVLVGCVAAASLALILDGLIRILEIAASRGNRALIGGALLVILAVLVTGLWPLLQPGSKADNQLRVVIGAKTFTEQYILAELIADRLAVAGIQAEILSSLGSTVAFDALAAGRIDCYVEYSGTIWTNYMKRQESPSKEATLQGVSDWLNQEHGIKHVIPLGFENSYAMAMTRTRADAMNIRSIDDLSAHAFELKLGSDYEFFGRPEWRELTSKYRLKFAELVTMDSTLMYSAVATNKVDVLTAFSTDGRMPAFDLIVLKDTRNAFPPYDALLLIGPQATKKIPALAPALASLEGFVDEQAMRAANKHVDVDGGTIKESSNILNNWKENHITGP